jgi:hypothetical protein
MHTNCLRGLRVTAIASIALLSGCAAQLAPSYDQSVLDGLIYSNKSVQIFFASVGTGVDASTYQQRADTYSNLIGNLNALGLQARSRPLPPLDYLSKVEGLIQKAGGPTNPGDPKISSYPSERAVMDASRSLQAMQSMDQAGGLRGGELQALENQTSTYLSQAITYETFLKR